MGTPPTHKKPNTMAVLTVIALIIGLASVEVVDAQKNGKGGGKKGKGKKGKKGKGGKGGKGKGKKGKGKCRKFKNEADCEAGSFNPVVIDADECCKIKDESVSLSCAWVTKTKIHKKTGEERTKTKCVPACAALKTEEECVANSECTYETFTKKNGKEIQKCVDSYFKDAWDNKKACKEAGTKKIKKCKTEEEPVEEPVEEPQE